MATERQKAAFKKILEKPRPIGQVMREVGYSENTIVDPQNLTKSKGWIELVEQYLPDEKLAEKHTQLLDDEKSEIQVRALDMAYKVKGSYAPEKSQSVNLNVNAESTEELSILAKKMSEEIKKGYAV